MDLLLLSKTKRSFFTISHSGFVILENVDIRISPASQTVQSTGYILRVSYLLGLFGVIPGILSRAWCDLVSMFFVCRGWRDIF